MPGKQKEPCASPMTGLCTPYERCRCAMDSKIARVARVQRLTVRAGMERVMMSWKCAWDTKPSFKRPLGQRRSMCVCVCVMIGLCSHSTLGRQTASYANEKLLLSNHSTQIYSHLAYQCSAPMCSWPVHTVSQTVRARKRLLHFRTAQNKAWHLTARKHTSLSAAPLHAEPMNTHPLSHYCMCHKRVSASGGRLRY